VKIAYLPGVFPMLSETPVLNQITGLVQRGHEVAIFGDRPKTVGPYHPSIDAFGLLSRSHYRPDLPPTALARWRKSFALLAEARGEERRALLRAMNALVHGTRSATGRLPLQTAQFLPVRQYDVIQGGFGEQGLKALRMKRVGAIRGKLVTAFRGADLSRHVQSRGAMVYRRLFREGDLFLPVSRAFQARLHELGCPPEKIAVHRTGIDLASFRFEPSCSRSRLRLLSVGRLVEKKGLEHALRALTKLGPGIVESYTVVGDGPLRARLERLARTLGLAEVSFAGAVPQGEVTGYLARADVLLAPSTTAADGDEEGIPNVLKEAMALGRPVVSTRHSGIPELVEHGVTGLLADEKDPEGLAKVIRHLYSHPEIWPSLLDAARRRVEEEYDIDRLNDQLVERYARLVGPSVGR
jgi:colanic acid/amylovoran biosynthesis glycosyltransferase